MTGFTTQQLLERAEENVKALRLASRQHAFRNARLAIETDLRLAEIALERLRYEAQRVLPEFNGWFESVIRPAMRINGIKPAEQQMAYGTAKLSWEACAAMSHQAPTAPEAVTVTCKYCGGSGYFRWQETSDQMPCPCRGCTQPKGNL